MPEFSTTAEVDLNVHYENGPDGPEIVGIFTGEVSKKQRAVIVGEICALNAKLEADTRLEYQLSRRDS